MNAASSASVRAVAGDAAASLAAGLAVALRSDGLTAIALPAPLAPAAAMVDAAPQLGDVAITAWTAAARGFDDDDGANAAHAPTAARELTIVGLGVARELRGTGEARWAELIAAARALGPVQAVRDGERMAPSALGAARPRFLGGAAFAPGAADRAPWLGFGDAWFALPRWTYAHDGAHAQLVLALDAREATDAARWHAELDALLAALAAPRAPAPQPPLVELAGAAADEWRTQVTQITAAIARGECSKIVATRTCRVALAGPVRAGDLLAALDARHADCVRVLVRPPGAGALVAASPERLVRRDGALVACDALAGTLGIAAPDGNGASAAATDRTAAIAAASAALLASPKERHEHEVVVSAIRDILGAAGAAIDAPAVPAVRALRHVVHLHTPFRATLRAPLHVLELAAALHPTPAVGGTPRAFAVEWIRAHEPVARGWYASPVGWFDLDGNGELAVAIRSGVLAGNRAQLWAGGGIVAGSDPERELAETEEKLRAMLGALGVAT